MGHCLFKPMSINPIFTESYAQSIQRSAFVKHAHKLVVHAVYDWNKPIKEEVFDIVKQFCHENHIAFGFREFLPEPLEEDREEIEKLPAFQIYVNGEYERTSYPSSGVNPIIEVIMKLDAKPKKSAAWSFNLRFPTFSLGRKKSRVVTSSGDNNL